MLDVSFEWTGSSHSQRSFALPLRGHGHATIKPEFGLLLREAFPPPPTKPTGTADSAIKQIDSNFEVDLESASADPAALCILIVDDSSANRCVSDTEVLKSFNYIIYLS